MNLEEARAIVAQMNAQERASIPQQLERFTLAQLGKSVHEWILNVSRKEGDRVRALVLAEKQRLETAPDTYQLGRWNEVGLNWLANSPTITDKQYLRWKRENFVVVSKWKDNEYIVRSIAAIGLTVFGSIAPEHIELL